VVTLQLAFLGFWGGALIGVFGATAKTFGGPVARAIAGGYVTFFTNTPALLQIYFFYFGLPEAGILLSSFVSVLLGLTLNAGAYLTEIMRAGFVSVRRTELEAAETLGFTLAQQVRYVILPHVAKTIYPALANFFIILVLGTSMAAVFGVDELTGTAINISTENYRWIEMFTVVAAIYIVLTFVASLLLAAVGRWGFRVRAKVF
jgi:polar amino acid transport system permease protein